MKKIFKFIFIVLIILTLTACRTRYKYEEGKINVTVTTNILANLVSEIGKEYVNVYSLMRAGVDPHQYVARPSDYTALSKADLIVANGLHLEGKMVSIIESFELDGNKEVISVGNMISTNSSDNLKEILIESSEFGGFYDPHFWFDIDLFKEAARFVYLKLSLIDEDNSLSYKSNYLSFINELDELKDTVLEMLEFLSLDKRYLITAHDAFGYFAKAFDFKAYSLQGLSTESEVSPSDINELVSVIKEHNVKAIFPETSVPVETINSVKEALASNGYIVSIGGHLFSDSLGDSDEDNTYVKMYLKNVNTIITAFKEGEGL